MVTKERNQFNVYLVCMSVKKNYWLSDIFTKPLLLVTIVEMLWLKAGNISKLENISC